MFCQASIMRLAERVSRVFTVGIRIAGMAWDGTPLQLQVVLCKSCREVCPDGVLSASALTVYAPSSLLRIHPISE